MITTTEISTEFSTWGSGLKTWVCPTVEGRAILNAQRRLEKLKEAGIVEYESAYGWCRYTLKSNPNKHAQYYDTVKERGEDFIAYLRLEFYQYER